MAYVLVHGGGSSAAFWDRLRPSLDEPSLAVDFPGRNGKPGDLATLSVEEEARSVVADVEAADLDGPIVLVVHSSGGLVVPSVVAALGERIERVILNAAAVPPEGGCGLDCMQARHSEGLKAALEAADRDGIALTTPGAPADPEAFRTAYGGEPLDDETLAYIVDPARCVPDTMHHYRQPVHWSQAAHVPVTYVLNTLDRPIPPTLQEEMAGRLPQTPTIVRVESGHIPAVTMPDRFAEIVRDARR